MAFPTSGKASTYSNHFEHRQTSSGDIYLHSGYTAALLPKANWYALPMGTRLRLTSGSRQVVVKVNDRGAGKVDPHDGHDVDPGRVLDLSRAAMAVLLGKATSQITNGNASVIQVQKIEVVPDTTPLGPVGKKP